MNRMQLFDKRLHGLCCWGIMKLETGAFFVLYIDLACLIGQLAYMAASSMIHCCSVYNFVWLLLCITQVSLCVLLFRAIGKRCLFLLKMYIFIGIVGKGVVIAIWAAALLIVGITKKTPFHDSQLILIGFLIFCVVVICFCGVVLIRCYVYFKEIHNKTAKCRQYRQIKLCPHKDHLHRENSGLLSQSTSNNQNFLLHELDLEKLRNDADQKARY